jgi:diacylglycerol kinase family enzyme
LLHNESAGSEKHAADEIRAAISRAGHEVIEIIAGLEGLISSIRARPCEVIAVAGGDGTVGRAACALAGCGIPLAILPLGTANNTALSLGVRGELDELVQGWSSARPVPFDLATLGAGDTLAPFSEAAGWGIFPAVIASTARMSSQDEPESTLERDRSVFQSVIESAVPRPYTIQVDGVSVTGEFLLVEIVNIPLIGPRLALSPDSDPSDGLLELMVAGESERTALYELASTGWVTSDVRLRTLRGKHITVDTKDAAFHRDGSLVQRTTKHTEFSVTVEPGSVNYLVKVKHPSLDTSSS